MPTKIIHITPARLLADDPFGLHEPLTFDDLERIEQALAEGTVSGAEADRLRAIRDEESAELAEAFRGITNTLSAHFGEVFPKFDIGPKYTDLFPKLDLGLDLTDVFPKFDIGSKYTDLFPKLDLGLDLTDVLPKLDIGRKYTADLFPKLDIGLDVSALLPKADFAQMLCDAPRSPIDTLIPLPDSTQERSWSSIESLDLNLFVDQRPAHMEQLAERQLEALEAACVSLEATAEAIVKSDKRAEERFEETKRMNRAQTRIVVVVTIVAALLSGLAGALLATFLR